MIPMSTRFLFEGTTDHWFRHKIKPGIKVYIVLKKNQRNGKLTLGVVKDILTKVERHTRGIKVRLMDGQIGRIQKILG